MKRGILLLLGVFVPSVAAQAQSITVCNFKQTAIVTVMESGELSARASADKTPVRIVFAGLDTQRPPTKGNLGESKLKILGNEGDELWLSEEPPLGGVNVCTVFMKSKVAIMSKQYSIGLAREQAFGLLSIGTCE